MERYIWLFPILFIVHDMEEIIGFGIWLTKNRAMLDKKYPQISRTYQNFSTEGMSVAVLEELLLCLLFCVLAVVTDSKYIYLLWLGGFVGYTLHLIIHIGQVVVIRKYIPALITSVLCLPISIWCIYQSILQLNCGIRITVIFVVVGILVVAVNLKFAQSLIGIFTNWKNKILS